MKINNPFRNGSLVMGGGIILVILDYIATQYWNETWGLFCSQLRILYVGIFFCAVGAIFIILGIIGKIKKI